MKRMAFLAAFGLLLWGVVTPVPAAELEPIRIPLVKMGRAPTIDQLMERYEPPRAFGGEREITPPRVPHSLTLRDPIVTERDPLAMGFTRSLTPTLSNSFAGIDSDDNASTLGFRVMPPDTNGDIGRTHYVQYNNLVWDAWDRDTKTRNGPFPGNSFWAGFGGPCEVGNDGDPIVLYDHLAGQWVFTQFNLFDDPAGGHQCVAVSLGEDPKGPYYLYDFLFPGLLNDYPKAALWADGSGSGGQSAYHATTNLFDAGTFAFVGVGVGAFERDAMLVGAPANAVLFLLPPEFFSVQPSHLESNDVPPATTCNKYIQAWDDDIFGSGAGPDGYQLWDFCADFTTGSFTFTANAFLEAKADFDSELCGFSRACIPQPPPGDSLDALGQFTMYRFANRYWPPENPGPKGPGLYGVISHTIDSGGNVAGIRFAEFDLGEAKSITKEGTLAPGDGISRWMPSVSLDKAGNMLIGYSRSSASTFPSVYYTGRENDDPDQQLKMEQPCVNGTGVQQGPNRWGDYAAVSVDPVDDCTFWFTNEYVETTGSFQWDTQVCVAKFDSCAPKEECGTLTVSGPGKVDVGQDFDLEICGANPGALVRVAGGRDLSGSVRVVPGCGPVAFDIGPRPNNFGSVTADGGGEAVSSQNLGSGFGNNSIYFQVVDNSKCTVSNVHAVDVNKVP